MRGPRRGNRKVPRRQLHPLRAPVRPGWAAPPFLPPDLSHKGLVGVLAGAARPESVYTLMRGANTNELLTGHGTRSIALTQESFDALPASRSVEYLREILVHNSMLPDPDRDRQLAAFERWLAPASKTSPGHLTCRRPSNGSRGREPTLLTSTAGGYEPSIVKP
jgi:hypothetical protein